MREPTMVIETAPLERTAPVEDAPAAAAEWLTPGRFALLLALLVVAAFPGVLFAGRSFIIRDFSLFSYPVAHFYRESFWRGEVPLWNPLNHCGLPFLAQWNTLVLYPFSLIYLLLPLSWSLSLFCVAHLFWGGLGMYFLAHRWTAHRLGAALAGIIFAFNGLTLNFLMWPCHVATFSWAPWVLLLAPLAWREGGKKQVWATLAGAMQMLAGGPETILLTWLILFALACSDWFRRSAPRQQIVLRFFAMAFLVALVCAAQLLPFLQLAAHSQRDSNFAVADWSMPLWGWANLLAPLFHTFRNPQGICFQPAQYWTSSYYLGIGTLLFAMVAVRRVRNQRVWLLAGLAVLGLVLALGERGLVYRGLRFCFPALGFIRYSVKYVTLTVILAPLLAAFGLKALGCDTRRLGRFEWSCALVLLVLLGSIATVGWHIQINGDPRELPVENALARAGLFIVSFGLLAAFLRPPGHQRPLLGCLLLVATWLDLMTHVPNQNPTAPASVYSRDWTKAARTWANPPKLGQSRAMLSPAAEATLRNRQLPDVEQNFLLGRLALLADCNLLEDVPQSYGFFSLVPEEANNATVLSFVHTNHEFTPLLDFMGVAQITAPDSLHDWTPRPSAMPLVTAGQRAVFVDDATAYDVLGQTNIDLRRIVLLPPEAQTAITATQRVAARVVAAQFANQKVSIQTEAPAACLVVISQTWYPAWQARIDGQPAKLWRANYAFQGLQVPAGRHNIELAYVDKPFIAGLALSAFGLMACAGLWLRAHIRQRALADAPASL